MMRITLKKGREKPVRNNHPWIFSGAINKVDSAIVSGDCVQVYAFGGELLGCGYFNAASSIAVRMMSTGPALFDADVLSQRIAAATQRRSALAASATSVYRLINAEGDQLPGLIVDRFDSGLCIQVQTAGMERYRQPILDALEAQLKPAFIYERSDPESRKQEGLSPSSGLLSGTLPQPLIIQEHGLRYIVNLANSQKTGFFADQRDSRLLLRQYAPGKDVLDCFCYTGGFALNARAAGAASVRAVDISADAIAAVQAHAELNNTPLGKEDLVVADIFQYLRSMENLWDVVILDPPKFAKHNRDIEHAARGYKDINLMAMRKMKPESVLFTFSCSQAIDVKLFRQIIFAAAADSGRTVQVLHCLCQPPDHPFNIAHLEGEYLKGLVLRVI